MPKTLSATVLGATVLRLLTAGAQFGNAAADPAKGKALYGNIV